MVRRCLIPCAVLVMAACVAPATRAAEFPVYPGAKRLIAPGMDPDMPGAVLVTPDAAKKVFDWHVARLKAAGWQIQTQEMDPTGDSFTVVAMKGEGAGQMIATVGGGKRDNAPGTQFTVMIIGDDKAGEAFRRIPTEELRPDEPEKDEPDKDEPIPGMPTEAQIREMERAMSRTPPNALQKAAVVYPQALETLLKAVLNWANSTTRPNLTAALNAVPSYMKAADALRAASSAAMENDAGGSYAGVLWSKQILTDIVVGSIIMALEEVRSRPASAARLQPIIKTKVRSLLDEEVRALRAYVKEGDQLTERAKQKDPGPGELDTPLTNEQIRATPETIYIPRTDLRVRDMWTPLPAYWRQVLKDTAIALRCWNAGCPEGCYTDDDGVTHCKAFGSYKHDGEETPKDVHCLLLHRTREREVEMLSHPMTIFCLLSLAIEVGDPDQLVAGGKLTVTVDGEKLTEIPLEKLVRPHRGNVNLLQQAAAPNAPPIPADRNILEQIARGVGILFGDDAEQAYRATSRSPWVVAESAGGEFHGYTLFLQVGAPVGGTSVMSSPWSYGSSSFAEYWQNLLRIAEKTHPALEREHKVKLRAEIGGIVSDEVEIRLPAAFRSLKDEVGVFPSWPGSSPDTWDFERELGPVPAKSVPDHTPLAIGTPAEDIQTNTRKMAMVYTWLIFQDWVKALATAGMDLAFSNIKKMLSDKAVQQAEKALAGSAGWAGVTRKALTAIGNKLTDVNDLPNSPRDWLRSSIGDKMKELGYNKLAEAFGGDFLKLAEEERKTAVLSMDLTKTGLRYSVQRQVAYHRRMIRHIGDTQLAFKKKVDRLVSDVQFVRNLASALSAGTLKPFLAPVIAGERGAAASLLVSDICAVREIWKQVSFVENYIRQENSWIR